MCLAVRSQDRMLDDAGSRHPAFDIVKRAIHETAGPRGCLGVPPGESRMFREERPAPRPDQGVVERLPVCPSVRQCGR